MRLTPLLIERKFAHLTLPALLVVLLLCAVLAWLVSLRRNAWRDADVQWPFFQRKPLASPEQVLYQRLVQALPGHMVLSRVPLCAVLGVRRGFDAATWSQRLRGLQYDFVLCSADATVLAAIELTGKARAKSDVPESDRIKQRASAAAGIRLLHWQAGALPDHAAIQAVFGLPLTQIFDEVAPSAHSSWWPPISNARSLPPLN